MVINAEKTKTGVDHQFTLNGEPLEMVTSFTYLGAQVTASGGCEQEVKTRIAIAKMMRMLDKIWKSHSITIRQKKRLVHALVFPCAKYACETWVLTADLRRRLEASRCIIGDEC